ncbi:putative anaerobic dehydrogenase [Desulfitobacterium dehalogenans ATCC 51507]|uniref:Putative anaerobic dehydrogenase n=1 Tax=Desulfitobacterium dehalogenans (strain ATCC 51507 / DSM 9161 / JW/IU-DC1) TaxID=756499 RepID=I4A5Y0_DESDJ|nr:nitrate reductase [Desulfitobacterium dehalogenans]AFL99364.1 putative anaerobic dehydrogenase [Desulfitobacterium dehalogenans ATCC 51507]
MTKLREVIKHLMDKSPLDSNPMIEVDEWVYSTCGYCSVGCGLYIGVKDGQAVTVEGNQDSPVNRGRLCVKGLYEWKFLQHPERATSPMIRKKDKLEPVSWEEALTFMINKMEEIRNEKGPKAIGVYHTGQLLLEEYYALGKLAKGVIGTPNVDSNTRLCMASAVKGTIRSFGTDGSPGCYEDVDEGEVLLIFGANPAEMHPQLWQRILHNREVKGTKIIVADPRTTLPAQIADIHLPLRPGTNIALLNAMIHVLIRENLLDEEMIDEHTVGFSAVKALVEDYPPGRGEELTGIPAETIVEAALLFGKAARGTTLYGQGVNQSMSATDTAALINTLHLITGKLGKPGCAPISLTGQASAMSNRDVGGSFSLPGFRNPANPQHRLEVAEAWKLDVEKIPAYTHDIMKMMELIDTGKLDLLWVIGTNPAVSLPDQKSVRKSLENVFLVVQDVYYPVETAAYADLFLPGAQWGEKTGTYTNIERRVNLANQAVEPPGKAKGDLKIFQEIAKGLGAEEGFSWLNPEEVFNEWKVLSKGRPNDMSGMTYERLEKEQGICWPCPDIHHPGTKRLYTARVFNTSKGIAQEYGDFNHEEGRARLWAIPYTPPPESPDEDFPLWLNTGSILEHYHTRTKTKRIPELVITAPEGFVELHPLDAERLDIREGERIRVVSRRGWIQVPAHISTTLSPGQVFVPYHFGDLDPSEAHLKQAANHLTLNWKDPFSKQPMYKTSACRIEKVGLAQ